MSRTEERRARAEVRRKLAEARRVLKELQTAKRAALVQISRDCKSARKNVRERVKAWKKLQAEILKGAAYGLRAEARNECEAAKRKAIKDAQTAADGVLAAITIERAHLAKLKRSAKPVNPRRRIAGQRAEEKRAEALDEIGNNMPAEYIDAWNAFKDSPGIQRAIRRASGPGSRLSATEAVLEYFQENPSIHYDLNRKIEADAIRDWEAREKALSKLAKRKRVTLEDIPF